MASQGDRLTRLETTIDIVIPEIKKDIELIEVSQKTMAIDIGEIKTILNGNPGDDGIEKRKQPIRGVFTRMPGWKKLTTIGIIVGIILRPEIKEGITAAFKWYFGLE